MGPPLDGGGDPEPLVFSASDDHVLQWGRRSMAAETSDGLVTSTWFDLLQWGRRSMAAETDRRAPPVRQRHRASMGPPLDGGGDSYGVRPTS